MSIRGQVAKNRLVLNYRTGVNFIWALSPVYPFRGVTWFSAREESVFPLTRVRAIWRLCAREMWNPERALERSDTTIVNAPRNVFSADLFSAVSGRVRGDLPGDSGQSRVIGVIIAKSKLCCAIGARSKCLRDYPRCRKHSCSRSLPRAWYFIWIFRLFT